MKLRLLLAILALPISAFSFDPETDLLSLHYDHAPDKDDGHSAPADRVMLETIHGAEWTAAHSIPVSGTYGKNRKTFNPGSDAVMDATWGGSWISAHADWDGAVETLTERWSATLRAGGDVWVKEGGQSDITRDVLLRLKDEMPELETRERIHVVQHSGWNEDQTSDDALAYTKQHTDYIRIRDANDYLNIKGGNPAFEKAATGHPKFGKAWQAAFDYYDPRDRLDFSDTGELMHILGLGEIDIDGFRAIYLDAPAAEAAR